MAGIIRSKRWELLKNKGYVVVILNKGIVEILYRKKLQVISYHVEKNEVIFNTNDIFDLNDIALIILYLGEYRNEV